MHWRDSVEEMSCNVSVTRRVNEPGKAAAAAAVIAGDFLPRERASARARDKTAALRYRTTKRGSLPCGVR